ncbi:unnamed protein product (macronuclear) [Paramecium tetraurelia]|uniref:FCP1 homology domain-containing protein n=1 Tax=Paramecium tetraurelia TaxID=5888 RepID=A0EHS0_PARTE|nr:uncharacterized protein GSPATT00027187001 [Paramecium tetraurelia]CAK94861.1 unnamed protein product [Paramecium tetraurelia]|eukprot:XP_001462234.1 hypothetical protein (macronuclear) [Paramecium tetraurelia strain d4-2]
MYYSNYKSTQSRLDSSALRNKLAQSKEQPKSSPKSYQQQLLKRFYLSQNLSKLLNQGQKKNSINKELVSTTKHANSTPRNATPKTNRVNQQYYFAKQNKQQTTLRLSEQISKTLQTMFNTPNHNMNKDYSQSKLNYTNTDRKYNINCLDSSKIIQKLKTENAEYRVTTERNENNHKHLSLDDFITQVSKPGYSKSKFGISTFKQAKSLSPTNRVFSIQRYNVYYVSAMFESMRNCTNQISQIFKDHAIQTFNSIDFCLNQQEKDLSHLQQKMVQWPKKNTQFNKTIVFDLDETLIHCNESNTSRSDISLPITFPSGDIVQAGINIRPWAREILQKLSEVCEVVIFTASHQCYASQVIESIDKNKVVSATLFRDKCIVTNEGVHIKDLRILGRDMKDIVLVDNAAYSFGVHIENGIPIIPYYDNKEDKELRQLYDFLITNVLPSFDCRKVLQQTFRLREFVNYISPKTAIDKLYC